MLVEMFSLSTSEKGVALVLECDDSVPEQLFTDESRVKQVLLNLLQNALKFTMEGQITV